MQAIPSGWFGVTREVRQYLRYPREAIGTGGRYRLRLSMESGESRTIAILAEKPSVA